VEFEFWGVRGSIAAAGSRTARYGGNTTCLEVNTPDGVFIFDAGTGIRGLGGRLEQSGTAQCRLFFTHIHWDHIQGLPFFTPLYDPDFNIELYSAHDVIGAEALETALSDQMHAPTFPVPWDYLQSQRSFHNVPAEGVSFDETRISWCALTHPNGIAAYRIESGGHSLVFATDVEHVPEGADPKLVDFARNADVLIYDAQYTPEEYATRKNFGHSTWEIGIEVANKAGVESLFLTHHDPTHDDIFLDELAAKAERVRPGTRMTKEGLRIKLSGAI
jgi:phosphoribosyl 1,2-cyclic phosphodiesterase